MYGMEPIILNAAIADGGLAAAVNINAAANTVALLRTMEMPGSVLYWGYRVTTAFDATPKRFKQRYWVMLVAPGMRWAICFP
jgi:hypothetical protein